MVKIDELKVAERVAGLEDSYELIDINEEQVAMRKLLDYSRTNLPLREAMLMKPQVG